MMSDRQAGATSRQLQAAPHGAHFVWVNDTVSYPTRLARHLGRPDITVHPRWVLSDPHRLRGLSALVLDHAVVLSDREAAQVYPILGAIRDRSEPA
jgi:hypothetical protein